MTGILLKKEKEYSKWTDIYANLAGTCTIPKLGILTMISQRGRPLRICRTTGYAHGADLAKKYSSKSREDASKAAKRKDALGAFFQSMRAFWRWYIIPAVYFYNLLRIDCGHGFLCVIMTERA